MALQLRFYRTSAYGAVSPAREELAELSEALRGTVKQRIVRYCRGDDVPLAPDKPRGAVQVLTVTLHPARAYLFFCHVEDRDVFLLLHVSTPATGGLSDRAYNLAQRRLDDAEL
jgi:hypothetical protein